MELNRRGFLIGLFGTAVVAAAGPMPTIVEPIDLEAWAKAVSTVYGKYISDAMIFGTSAIKFTDKFPYVENVPLDQLTMEQLTAPSVGLLPFTSELSEARKAVSNAIAKQAIKKMDDEEKVRRHMDGTFL